MLSLVSIRTAARPSRLLQQSRYPYLSPVIIDCRRKGKSVVSPVSIPARGELRSKVGEWSGFVGSEDSMTARLPRTDPHC